MYLDKNKFKFIVANTPLISIDLIIKNEWNQFLLGLRKNRPAQESWFVPGGRVLKGESLDKAFERLTAAEIGNAFALQKAEFRGVFQHFYDDSVMSKTISTHYVVLAYELSVKLSDLNLPEEQHSDYKWFKTLDILEDDCVHKHTKWYFE